MRKFISSILINLVLMFFALPVMSQQLEVLKYTPEQIEALFLKENLSLIAEKMNISLADAEIAQAKLWDNPELSIGSVNLWSTQKQKEGLGSESFPRNTQFSVEISQMIQTANKRGKLVNAQKVSKEIAISEFEEVLRGLKTELRNLIYEIEYLQSYKGVLSSQRESLELLIAAYAKQTAQGNVAKSELLRLQSGLLELRNEINETQTDLSEQQKSLKSLLNISPLYIVEIENGESVIAVNPDNISLISLFEEAREMRPDIKKGQLQTKFYEKSLAYEKAQRIPDVTLSASYDRYGGVWKDYFGFGVSFDLPFLNRNQGNIKAAKISVEQSKIVDQQQQNTAQQEIVEAFSNYTTAYRFYKEIKNNELLTELDEMLDVYTKNFLNRNVSMLEYLDFMEAYKSNKQIMLSSRKNMCSSFEELQNTVGTEIK